MGSKFCKNLIILIMLLFNSQAFADAGFPVKPEKTLESAPIMSEPSEVKQHPCDEIARKVFSLGRGVGAAYYYLLDLYDKSENSSYNKVQQEYNDTLQNLNIIDIILDDLSFNGRAKNELNKIRMNFYNALQNQDLSETKLAFVRDRFIVFYEDLTQEITMDFSCQEGWLLSLGFYTSFQLESLRSEREEKILLSGFEKIMSKRSVVVPKHVYDDLVGIYRLDKPFIKDTELVSLENNLVNVIEYFSNYPESESLFNEKQDLAGVWQGILFNPDREKYDIRLSVQEDLTATMDIEGIAYDVMISDIRVINNYFTLMFKPFGTEKLYLRFNAKLSEDVFSGEITDLLGEKGYWALGKIDERADLSEEKLDKMVSHIKKMEEKLKEMRKTEVPEIQKDEIPQVKAKETEKESSAPIMQVKNEQSDFEKLLPEKKEPQITSEPLVNNDLPEKSGRSGMKEKQDCVKVVKEEKTTVNPDEITVLPAKEATSDKEYYEKEGKGVIKKLKSFFKKLFSYINFL